MIVIQRQYGYETIGLMAFGAAFVSLFLPLGDLGFSATHSKRLNEKGLDSAICNGTFVSIKLVLNFFMMCVIIFFLKVQEYLGYGFENEIIVIVIYLYMVRYFIYNLNKIFNGIFNARLEVAKKVVPTTISRFIMMTLKITIALFFYETLGVEYLIASEILAALFLTLLFSYFLTKIEFRAFNWDYYKLYSSYAFPLIFIGLVVSINKSVDKVLLQYFLGSESVGVYVISEKLAFFLLVVSSSITKLLFPSFSSLYSRNKLDRIKELSQLTTKYVSQIIIPIIITFLIFSEEILILLFGPDAIKSANILRILIISAYILAISLPYSIQISSTGFLRKSFLISILSLLINFFLNIYLIPKEFLGIQTLGLGEIGAAYSFGLSALFTASAGIYYSFKITKSKFYYKIWKHIFSLLLVYYFVSYVSDIYFIYYLLPLYFIFIVFSFVFILYILGDFKYKDIQFYSNLVKPSKMSQYISKELTN